MRISRHFIDVERRRVHYRRCGDGPVLLMVHQSPNSSAEYIELMREWGKHFTCIAPDTPGFGQSSPLERDDADIGDFGDALVALLDALGLDRVAAYGFHSGGIILMRAVATNPERFTALAIGGYAIWTDEERALFAERYLPAFRPTDYGEHLVWLWNRILEQSWFFPWFAADADSRLPGAHVDVARIDAAVRDMLESGDAYRIGYGAVLRAPRDIPQPDADVPPLLITAYDGDPLQEHIDQLGPMPGNWQARKVTTQADHRNASLDFLREWPGETVEALPEVADAGFAAIATDDFDGLIHWRGAPRGDLHLHVPGAAIESSDARGGLVIDLPGHGLSDDWPETPPETAAPWEAIIAAIAEQFDCMRIVGLRLPVGDPERLYPDLAPDRFGTHLVRTWQIVRAERLFEPWYKAEAKHARDFVPEALAPDRLAVAHRARLRANRAARAWHKVLQHKEDRPWE